MAWKDARGSTRVVVTAVHHVAHSDDAKSRTHDASQLARKGFPSRLIVGGTSLGLVVVAAVTVLALNGRGDPAPKQLATVGSTAESASPSAEPAVVSSPAPEEVMAQSQPSGVWRAQTLGRYSIARSGARKKQTYHDKGTRWTLSSDACTADGCTGQIASTSGSSFAYAWNGKRLVVTRDLKPFTDKKEACIDLDTGQTLPIAESAARVTYHYRFGPFQGSATSMKSTVTTRLTYEFFGTCHAGPKDTMTYVEDQVITQLRAS